MPRYPFRLELAGMILVGEVGIEEQFAARDPITVPALSAGRRPGRPSHRARIAEAAKRLGAQLNGGLSLAERRRLVLKELAQSWPDPSLPLPSTRTVESWLAEHPVRRKLRRNSNRPRIGRIGGR